MLSDAEILGSNSRNSMHYDALIDGWCSLWPSRLVTVRPCFSHTNPNNRMGGSSPKT